MSEAFNNPKLGSLLFLTLYKQILDMMDSDKQGAKELPNMLIQLTEDQYNK